MKIYWTDTALDGLRDAPAAVGREILRKIRTARRYPNMFPERQRGRYRGYRWFPVGDWLVFYKVGRARLIILCVMPGMMHDA